MKFIVGYKVFSGVGDDEGIGIAGNYIATDDIIFCTKFQEDAPACGTAAVGNDVSLNNVAVRAILGEY